MLKICILTPIYGVEKYIEQCARSLFEQSYASIEYIFVDDCTPDKSIGILQALLKEYPGISPPSRMIVLRTLNAGASYSSSPPAK